ncbi:MAG: hypothetical protein JOY97_03590 [Hyphomicrobiales bacterium]|nr:hypothetical protein [Hyphomicrobiales bacterium]
MREVLCFHSIPAPSPARAALLRAPAFSITALTGDDPWNDRIRFFVFHDIGRVWNIVPRPNEPAITTLARAGAGFHYTVDRYVVTCRSLCRSEHISNGLDGNGLSSCSHPLRASTTIPCMGMREGVDGRAKPGQDELCPG